MLLIGSNLAQLVAHDAPPDSSSEAMTASHTTESLLSASNPPASPTKYSTKTFSFRRAALYSPVLPVSHASGVEAGNWSSRYGWIGARAPELRGRFDPRSSAPVTQQAALERRREGRQARGITRGTRKNAPGRKPYRSERGRMTHRSPVRMHDMPCAKCGQKERAADWHDGDPLD